MVSQTSSASLPARYRPGRWQRASNRPQTSTPERYSHCYCSAAPRCSWPPTRGTSAPPVAPTAQNVSSHASRYVLLTSPPCGCTPCVTGTTRRDSDRHARSGQPICDRSFCVGPIPICRRDSGSFGHIKTPSPREASPVGVSTSSLICANAGDQGRDRTGDLPLFRRSSGLRQCVSAGQAGSEQPIWADWSTWPRGLAL